MFPRALRIARVGGVDVRVDPSWLVIALLFVWSFLSHFSARGRGQVITVVMAVTTTVAFFGSVLAHELGHAFEARHRDLRVHGITLFLFGGATEMDMRTRRPWDEFTVAAIGPWTSLVLAAVFGLVTVVLDTYLVALHGVAVVTGTLAWINLGLALFNIVPGAPLDGGRVLRAGLWALTGDRHRAQIIASRAGQALAIALAGVGLWTVARGRGGFLGGLWLGVIALFMFHAARRERVQALTLRLVDGHTASEFVPIADDEPAPATVPVGAPTFAVHAPMVEVLLALHDAPGVAVVDDDGTPVAVVNHEAAERMLRHLQHQRRVAAGVATGATP